MAAANGSKTLRVLVVYGSESGNAERAAEKLAASWAAKAESKVKVDPQAMCGNDAAKRFDSLKDDHDVLIILTSSFGEGEAPANYEKFLLMLAKGAKAESESPPLKGMQHAVLGFGDSVYETYMNCPRLTDKFLEECGSRRVQKRHEVDASAAITVEEVEKENQLEKDWAEAVWQALWSSPSASDPPAAPWCEEGKTDKIFEEAIPSDRSGGSGGVAGVAFFVVAILVFFLSYYLRGGQ
jgi:sulfite reductase alpha subunit-like flavoprotein